MDSIKIKRAKGAGRPKGQGVWGEATKPMRIPISRVDDVVQYLKGDEKQSVQIPLYASRISAGFPSPADDHMEGSLDLNEYLIKRPSTTFFLKVSGDSMIKAGIHEGDLLIVDKSIEPKVGHIVISALSDHLTVKRLTKEEEHYYLSPENDAYQPIPLSKEEGVTLWGVVTSVIHKV